MWATSTGMRRPGGRLSPAIRAGAAVRAAVATSKIPLSGGASPVARRQSRRFTDGLPRIRAQATIPEEEEGLDLGLLGRADADGNGGADAARILARGDSEPPIDLSSVLGPSIEAG